MERNFGQDLIIGASSQIAQYLPRNITRVSSRQIPEWVFSENWNRVYICFSEQRTSLAKNSKYKSVFFDVNVTKTIDTIDRLKSQKIVCFSTTELWNFYNGPIALSDSFNFQENYYTESKLKMTNILSNRQDIILLFPFNFNSKHRRKTFLFGKIFDSIFYKKKIEIGSTYFYRDILHAKFVADQTIAATESKIIGSGRLVYVNDYIRDLYKLAQLEYNNMIIESDKSWRPPTTFWLNSPDNLYSYNQLLADSMEGL
jgi:hypothetical protein